MIVQFPFFFTLYSFSGHMKFNSNFLLTEIFWHNRNRMTVNAFNQLILILLHQKKIIWNSFALLLIWIEEQEMETSNLKTEKRIITPENWRTSQGEIFWWQKIATQRRNFIRSGLLRTFIRLLMLSNFKHINAWSTRRSSPIYFIQQHEIEK